MDNTAVNLKTADTNFFWLTDNVTGETVYSGSSRVKVKNEQNVLWAGGVKTTFNEK
jgi:hypothetical protein